MISTWQRKRLAAERRRKRLARRRLELLENRVLLHGVSPTQSPALEISEEHYDANSILVRYHAATEAFAPAGLSDFGAVPGLRQLELPDGLDVQQSVEFYRNHPGVLYAEPNFEISLSATPNDPGFDSLWGLNNVGQTGGTTDADIDATEAWDVTTGSADTIVAVVDTGVDYLHPDLAANMWSNPGEIPGDGIDNDGNGFIDDVHGYDFVSNDPDPMDDHDHGTHVAGTIGAVANNGIGIVGVSWDVQIMAVKFIGANGSGSTSAAIAAIQYAVDNGATISNHSWGFNGNYSQSLSDAVEYSRQADHIFVAAAGNGGGDQIGDDNDSLAFWPSNFQHDNLIAVAALDHNDQLASFSNYGLTQVDLGAPGVGIYSTTRNNTYNTFNGTSMATPHVAGAVALLRSQYPNWSYTLIRDRILDTVDLVPSMDSRSTTGGRLNVAAAVAPDFDGPSVIESSPSGEVMKVQDRMHITFDERIDLETFTADDIVSFQGPDGAVTGVEVHSIDAQGREFEIVFDPQTTLGDYTVVFGPEIRDPFGNALDQNGNGANGEPVADQVVVHFTIIPDTVGPYVVSTSPDAGLNVPTDRVRVTFDEPIDSTTFSIDNIFDFTGPGGPIGVTSIQPVSSSQYDVIFPMQDALGAYSFSIGGEITDPIGNMMDQDGDGVGGEVSDDRYQAQFNLEMWQYADFVVDFSSQYTTTFWSAEQALGEPDTFAYGDIETAWAPRPENGTIEHLTVGFDTPLLASGVVIRETFGNGFVRKVEARNEISGEYVTVAEPQDDSPANVPADFLVTWPQTTFPVDAVRITVDTDQNQDAYEEIDAVQLRGVTVPDADGARIIESSLTGSVAGPVTRAELTFDESILDGTFTLDDIQEFVGPEGDVTASAVNRITSTRYEVLFPAQTVYGDYTLTIGPEILDLDGNPLNQDRDSIDGEAVDDIYQTSFKIELWQFADAVVDFSSQFGSTSWSAAQALGPSDTFAYGDSREAWAPASSNGTTESLTVAFPEPVLASGVQIRETYGNGFVRRVEVRDAETGAFSTVSTAVDDSQAGAPVDYLVSWPLTTFAVDAVRIEVDTDHSFSFEEIDSVQLRGVPAPDVKGAAVIATDPDASHPETLDHIDLFFSEAIQDGTFTSDDIISFDGPEGPLAVTAIDRVAEDHYRLSMAEQSTWGSYRLVIGSEILDLADNPLDQNRDGINGDPVSDQFELEFNLELWQYASNVVAFSSQYSATSWSAEAALGEPDTDVYGDKRTAWAPKTANGTIETLTLGFDTPVQSSGVIIRETYGNGFVTAVEARDSLTGDYHLVASPSDDSLPGTPVDFVVSWPLTDYTVDAVRITVNTDHSITSEEIDAVTLRGVVPPDVTGARVVATTPDAGTPGPIDRISLTFNEPIDAETFRLADVHSFTGPGGAIAVNDIVAVADDRFEILFDAQVQWGTYAISIGPDVLDLSGNPMDQNGDGVSGDSVADQFDLEFELELWQNATAVLDFSSQYSSTSWSAEQVLGEPDTLAYGDSRLAWAPKLSNGADEFITVEFDTAVLSTGAVIRETYGNGFVTMIEARDFETGQFHVVSTDADDSQPGQPVDYLVSWPATTFGVDALRVTVDTTHSITHEEIDAITLRGVVAPDTKGPRVIATDPSAIQSGALDRIEVVFNEAIDPSTVSVDDVTSLVGPSGAIPVDSVVVTAADTLEIRFATQTDYGVYSYSLGPGLTDLVGNAMDQDRDGVGGEPNEDAFSSTFDLELSQYASSVIAFSSQYSSFGWSAADALGAPDTVVYGDARTAWAPRYANSGDQTLTVGFETAVYSNGAIIRETFGNGFVTMVEARDADTGLFHVMSVGPDTSLPGTPVDYGLSWERTSFKVDALRITIDTYHTAGYEEIDAVTLRGITD